MKNSLAITLALSGSTYAALIPRQSCCFQLTASGGQSGTLGQLSDGQNRVGQSGLSPATYCISGSSITDSSGRGCILTPPTTQFQCDVGATPTPGFAIGSGGSVTYNGSTQFYACPTGDNGGYNIYTTPVSGQTKCVAVTLSTQNGACAPASSSKASTTQAATTSKAPAPSTTAPAPSSSKPATSSAPAPSSSKPATSSAPAPSSSKPATSSAPASSSSKPTTSSAPAPSSSKPATSAPAPPTSAPKPSTTAATTASAPAPPQTVTKPVTVTVTVPGSCSSSPALGYGSSAPASSKPASSAPATSAPATSAPASSKPATSAPATSAPASSKPATSAPATSAPATSAPASSKPATSAPATSAPATSAPASSKPATSGPATSQSATPVQPSSTGSKTCATTLSSPYQTPHLIVPVSSSSPNTPGGTSYNGTASSTVSSIFNFDIPSSYAGKTCTVLFLFPTQAQLETSSFTLSSSSGSLVFSSLSGTASQSTTWNNQPKSSGTLWSGNAQPGNSYVLASGACAAGQTVSIGMSATGSYALNFFEDWNPSPIGVFINSC